MPKRVVWFIIIFLAVAILAAAFLFWYKNKPTTETVINQPVVTDIKPINPLTGLAADEAGPVMPIAVMLDNSPEVAGIAGINQSAIVFEAPVEGGLTRLMAIYDSLTDVDRIGPVRSLRPYFLQWAESFGGILMHVGGSPDALSAVVNSKIFDLNQIGADELYFSRDAKIAAPHNVFTSHTMWIKAMERNKLEPALTSIWSFQSQEANPDTKQQATITYSPDNIIAWLYNPEKNNYLRYVNRKLSLTDAGEPVTADNIIIIDVDISAVDPVGRLTMKTTGSGGASVMQAGKLIPARWIKDKSTSRLIILNAETQNEVTLQPGRTWVQVVSSFDAVSLTQE